MPNWCYNILIVTGTKEELDKFSEIAETEDRNGNHTVLSEEPFVPYPEKFKKITKKKKKIEKEWEKLKKVEGYADMSDKEKEEFRKKYDDKNPWNYSDGFNSGGYEWCIINYGTKWGCCSTTRDRPDPEELVYHFESAWSPPSNLMIKMGQMFPDLRFELEYEEPGMAFKGTLVMEDGELIVDECHNYTPCGECGAELILHKTGNKEKDYYECEKCYYQVNVGEMLGEM